jgi:hypothetical protein
VKTISFYVLLRPKRIEKNNRARFFATEKRGQIEKRVEEGSTLYRVFGANK